MPYIHEHRYRVGEKGAALGILSNIVLFVIKLFAGVVGRSQAMVADSFHTASDAFTSIGVLIGFKIAKRPADEHHPFGHGRAESIVAKLVSVVLILVGLGVLYSSARILIQREGGEPGNIALIIAVISIIVKEVTYRYVIHASRKIDSTSLKADAYHHRSDVLSSVAALIGIIGAKTGRTYMDPLAGIVVGGFIIKIGVEAFHRAYDELMDAAPPKELKDRIRGILTDVEGVLEVKRIMVRKTGIDLYLEITIGVDGDKTVREGHFVTVVTKKALFDSIPNLSDLIVHVEPSKSKL